MANSAARTPFTAPAISLPKGGGAIRGIGEKFAANPVTGTGSLSGADRRPAPAAPASARSCRFATTPARGNGPFGFGWSLSLPGDHPQDRQGPAAVRATTTSPTSSSCPAPRTWCRCSCASRRRVGPARRRPPRRRTADAWSPLPAARRGAVRPHRAVDGRSRPATCTGARSPATTSRRCTAATPTAAIADPADPRPRLQLAALREHDDNGNAIVYDYKRGGLRRRRRRPRRHERNRTPAARAPSATSSASATATASRRPRSSPTSHGARTGCSRSSSTTASTTAMPPDARDAGAWAVPRATRSRPTAPGSRSARTGCAGGC